MFRLLLTLALVTPVASGCFSASTPDSARVVMDDSGASVADSTLRTRLTPIQYSVTQMDDTEPPFDNAYWDNKRPGIYVDVVSGEPLFSSTDKFVSGTGWPSFTKPLVPENIKEVVDRSLGVTRIEVRSATADSHLGHIFGDGPAPTGDRYCMNSAAMRFIPADQLEAEGYGEFAALFDTDSADA